MQLRELVRMLLYAFAGSLLLYIIAYRWIEGRREKSGPWEVLFQANTNAAPYITIAQTNLGITNVTISFPDERLASNVSKTIYFDIPTKDVAFGKKIFIDTTFLPGTLTLGLFTHEIELLPRVLYIDRRQIPWQNNTSIVVRGTTNIPPQKRK